MDGLLIDSEPCWQQAGSETLLAYDICLTDQQYYATTGLRTPEWIEWWFRQYNIDSRFSTEAIKQIETKALENIRNNALGLFGVEEIFQFFKDRKFRIGLASSSPVAFIQVVAEKLGIADKLDSYSSAESLKHGKPHPEVFLNCATQLGVSPLQCVCFEDSFNGLIAAKAARMKCVVIPAPSQKEDAKWVIADLQLNSLAAFNDEHLKML